MTWSDRTGTKPHIGKWNGRWALWIERGRGLPNAVPDNTFRAARIGALWLYQQQLQENHSRRP